MKRLNILILIAGLVLALGMFILYPDQYSINMYALLPYASILLPLLIIRIMLRNKLANKMIRNPFESSIPTFMICWLFIYNLLYYIFMYIDFIDLNKCSFRMYFYFIIPALITLIIVLVKNKQGYFKKAGD